MDNQLDAILELQALPQWVGGKYPDKAPLNPHTGYNAKSNDAATWGTYAQALGAQARYDWDLIGVALSPNGSDNHLVGIDLDHCASHGVIQPWAQTIVDRVGSYAEFSPSYRRTPHDHGVRIFVRGDIPKGLPSYKGKPEDWASDDDLTLPGVPEPPRCPEMYKDGRWLTVTGDHVVGTPTTIETRPDVVAEIYNESREAQRAHKALVTAARRPQYSKGTAPATVARIGSNERAGDDYSERGPAPTEMLERHGWTVHHETSEKIHYTRPGKDTRGGESANWHKEKRTFYNFSGNAPVFDVEGYSLFQVYALLEYGGDWSAAAKALAAAGYGSEPTTHKFEPDVANAPFEDDDLPVTTFHLTDAGNAKRLVAQYGHELRYCYDFKKWFVWDGTRWGNDRSGQVMRRAKATVQNIYREASKTVDEDKRKAIAKHAMRSENLNRQKAMIESAQDEVPVLPEMLDRDPWLFNVKNGTVDLRTGKLLPHDSTRLITQIAPVEYDRLAPCSQWIEFLDRIFDGNQDLINFVCRALGYSLTGMVSEQCLFINWGEGDNGKSTLQQTVSGVLGDYGQTTPIGTLTARRTGNAPSSDLARLRGARYVTASEADKGVCFAESTVKLLTGGDTIATRFLFGEIFEFVPQFKLWISTNHKPVIKGTDHAIWRRIRLIPFTVRIPKAEQDKDLANKLQAELPGILSWMVQGCLEWQRVGLEPPNEVSDATKAYRGEMDTLGSFIEECCKVEERAKVGKRELYDAFIRWGGEGTSREFLDVMRERGFTEGRLTGGRFCWEGIGLWMGESEEK